MQTKLLMISSAAVMFALGALLTFAPAEVVTASSGSAVPNLVLAMQATGALYLGFAILNWLAKDNLLGGIYSRPVALGNFLHFFIVAMAAGRAVAVNHHDIRLAVIAFVYGVFAVWFGLVTFGSPV